MPNVLFKMLCIADGSMPVVVYITSVPSFVSMLPLVLVLDGVSFLSPVHLLYTSRMLNRKGITPDRPFSDNPLSNVKLSLNDNIDHAKKRLRRSL